MPMFSSKSFVVLALIFRTLTHFELIFVKSIHSQSRVFAFFFLGGWHIWMLKKRWQEYKEELYKKDLHNPDNHDGVITDLEPDILECEVK